MLDPGIGFGKTPEQSMTALARLGELQSFGLPLLVGASRKRFISMVTPSEPHQRLGGSIAAHLIAANAARASSGPMMSPKPYRRCAWRPAIREQE